MHRRQIRIPGCSLVNEDAQLLDRVVFAKPRRGNTEEATTREYYIYATTNPS